jgi:hypothetical protein
MLKLTFLEFLVDEFGRRLCGASIFCWFFNFGHREKMDIDNAGGI